jgi:hypothetical protein
MKFNNLSLYFLFVSTFLSAQNAKPPIMGWSSWNNYRIHINEHIITSQADAMVSSGMKAAGYAYVNIDDGFFGGRTADGTLYYNKAKFPKGMKYLSDYIHAKGLKAGIYSEAGTNTCGSQYDNDSLGLGAGLYQNDEKDCNLFLNTWGYDFLKVDYCGAQVQKLDEKTRYTEVKKALDKTGREYTYNICRWQFPGTWALPIADSWRVSGDITSSFKSVCHIIDINAYLAPYASAGHYNDMDMLQVGRGMTADEDKAHFSMWCMLMSPLLAGNDLGKMTQQTIDILTNKEVIAINQDAAFVQARKVKDLGDIEYWVKPLNKAMSPIKAVTILNRSATAQPITLNWDEIGIKGDATVRDLWEHADKGTFKNNYTCAVPAHGVVVLKISAKKIIIPAEYEAEYSFVNLLGVVNKAKHKKNVCFSGGYGVAGIGNDPDNWIEFRDVYVPSNGKYTVKIDYVSPVDRDMTIELNSFKQELKQLNSGGINIVAHKSIALALKRGYNCIRIYNSKALAPDVDKITIKRL